MTNHLIRILSFPYCHHGTIPQTKQNTVFNENAADGFSAGFLKTISM